jgi:Lrp/AsnC family transcriptional regulator, leucine-responsive regulatory protein
MRRRIQSALDPVGWKILAALQENARLSFTELGRQVGLTGPAVAERVRRLEEAGVIRGYRVELGFERLGLPIAALIRVSAPEEKYPPLKAGAAALPEVLECHHVTGTDSLVLKVVATSVRHLEAVIGNTGTLGDTGDINHPVVASRRTGGIGASHLVQLLPRGARRLAGAT